MCITLYLVLLLHLAVFCSLIKKTLNNAIYSLLIIIKRLVKSWKCTKICLSTLLSLYVWHAVCAAIFSIKIIQTNSIFNTCNKYIQHSTKNFNIQGANSAFKKKIKHCVVWWPGYRNTTKDKPKNLLTFELFKWS